MYLVLTSIWNLILSKKKKWKKINNNIGYIFLLFIIFLTELIPDFFWLYTLVYFGLKATRYLKI